MTQSTSLRFAICAMALGLAQTAAGAEPDAAGTPVARNASVTITRAEFQAEITRIPADMRAEFLASNKRVGDLLSQMLLRKTLAKQARSERLDQNPVNAARIGNEVDRVLAQLRISEVESAAGVAFEAKRAAYVGRAREVYAANRDQYRRAEEISASHILFDAKQHTSDDAKRLAQEARAKIAAGADFNAVAKQISEDPSAADNAGRLGWFTRDRMDATFSKAAFALKTVGEVSEPVQSSFGWHIIRLDDRRATQVRPFDEVRDEIIAGMKRKFMDDERDAVLAAIRGDSSTAIDDAAVKAMVEATADEAEHSHSTPAAPARPGGSEK